MALRKVSKTSAVTPFAKSCSFPERIVLKRALEFRGSEEKVAFVEIDDDGDDRAKFAGITAFSVAFFFRLWIFTFWRRGLLKGMGGDPVKMPVEFAISLPVDGFIGRILPEMIVVDDCADAVNFVSVDADRTDDSGAVERDPGVEDEGKNSPGLYVEGVVGIEVEVVP